MAKFKVLYPDVLSADDNAVERKISGDSAEFLIFNEKSPSTVSYTHLTLPTIYSV